MGRSVEKDTFPRRFGCAYNQAASEKFFTSKRLQRRTGHPIPCVGCAGGKAPGCHLTSFLINEELLLEGGSAASGLTIEEQARLTGVVVSHAHLDHIAELPYLADNIFGLREDSLQVIGAREVLEVIQGSIFNNAVWPDFARFATRIRRYSILGHRGDGNPLPGRNPDHPYAVEHKGTTFGFIIQDGNSALLYTSDTGPTEAIWRGASETENLCAIITEVSFPNRMEELARMTRHLTPAMLHAEMRKMPPGVPVYIFHIKAQYHDETTAEIEALGEPRIRVLKEGKTYHL